MAAPGQRPARPARGATALVLWLLLALFVVYPLVMMAARMFTVQGQFSTAGLWTLLTDRHQLRAFGNSLLLAVVVGVLGTLLGFVFAFTAARTQLPPWLQRAIDASVLLPLVSPPFTTAIAFIFSFGPRGLITTTCWA
jgi:iron(III) transport system permease protein